MRRRADAAAAAEPPPSFRRRRCAADATPLPCAAATPRSPFNVDYPLATFIVSFFDYWLLSSFSLLAGPQRRATFAPSPPPLARRRRAAARPRVAAIFALPLLLPRCAAIAAPSVFASSASCPCDAAACRRHMLQGDFRSPPRHRHYADARHFASSPPPCCRWAAIRCCRAAAVFAATFSPAVIFSFHFDFFIFFFIIDHFRLVMPIVRHFALYS